MNILETSVQVVSETSAPVVDMVTTIVPVLEHVEPILTAVAFYTLWQWIPLF